MSFPFLEYQDVKNVSVKHITHFMELKRIFVHVTRINKKLQNDKRP
jgi:hypothetical protein